MAIRGLIRYSIGNFSHFSAIFASQSVIMITKNCQKRQFVLTLKLPNLANEHTCFGELYTIPRTPLVYRVGEERIAHSMWTLALLHRKFSEHSQRLWEIRTWRCNTLISRQNNCSWSIFILNANYIQRHLQSCTESHFLCFPSPKNITWKYNYRATLKCYLGKLVPVLKL